MSRLRWTVVRKNQIGGRNGLNEGDRQLETTMESVEAGNAMSIGRGK